MLHDQERLTRGRGAAVEQTDDVLVVEGGENLPFDREAAPLVALRDRRARQLDGDLLVVEAVGAFSAEDLAHAAGPDLFGQAIRADLGADSDAAGLVFVGPVRLQSIVCGEQTLDIGAQVRTRTALVIQDRRAAGGVEHHDALEQRFEAAEIVWRGTRARRWIGRRHHSLNARNSHARANVQCRLTVAGAMPRMSAVS